MSDEYKEMYFVDIAKMQLRDLGLYMRTILYFIIFFAFCMPVRAQNLFSYIDVNSLSSLNFFVTNPAQLEQKQTVPNALKLSVRSAFSNCSVFARISQFSAPSGYPIGSSPIALKWSFDTSNDDYNLNKSEIKLSTSNVLLFNQRRSLGGLILADDYYYDVILDTPGYDMVPGIYNITILITMTVP